MIRPLLKLYFFAAFRFFRFRSMKQPVKIGIAGARFAARFHLASYQHIGGVHNWMEIYGNNHRMRCNINSADADVLYNPVEKQLEHVYLTEKLGTKQGWSFPAPNEDRMCGYPQEIQDFMECLRDDREPQSDAMLAADTVSMLYAAYVSAHDQDQETDIPLIA